MVVCSTQPPLVTIRCALVHQNMKWHEGELAIALEVTTRTDTSTSTSSSNTITSTMAISATTIVY
jgi:hypothetical protein